MLVAVADAVFPARDEPRVDGAGRKHPVNDGNYRNRLVAAVEDASPPGAQRRALAANISDFASRLDRLDELTSKGVHDQVTDSEVRHGVIHTYLIAGEVLEVCGS